MSTRANPTVIGGFVVGAAVLLVVALLFWGGTGLFHTKLDYVLFFDSAVTGLQKGAPVMFRGVRVGEVTDVQIRWGTPLVAVYIAVEPELLKGVPTRAARAQLAEAVQRGLRAQLRAQSFVTGVLFIALDVAPGTPIVLRGIEPKVPELPTIPTVADVWLAKFEKIADTMSSLPLDDIARAATETLESTTRLLRSPEILRAVKNTDALMSDTRTLVRKVDTLATTLNAQVGPLASDTRATLDATQKALADVPRLIEDARRLIVKVDAHADPLLASLQRTSGAAQTALEQARTTLSGVDGVLTQDSSMGYELVQMMHELRQTARALRSLADYLERVPDAPVYGVRRTGDKR
jgi:paraquat-inducible protein B